MKPLSVTTQMRDTEKYFPEVLFVFAVQCGLNVGVSG